jgi:hypothetical protein
VAAVSCQTPPPPAVSPFSAGTEELVAKSKELNRAFTARDAKAAEALLAPEYTLHFIDKNMRGSIAPAPNAPRGKWLADLFSRLSNGPLEWNLVDARVYGNLGVVVTYYRWSGTRDGRHFAYEGYITDVWIRRSNRWQVLESHADLLPPS